jgi:ABC-type transport system involved in cytochrome c biogenesis permease subunit
MKNLLFFQFALACYVLSTAGYIVFIIQPKRTKLAQVSLLAAASGLVLHAAYFWVRWTETGRIPITNYFEAINALGMGIVLVFLIMEFRYKIAALGSFMLPLVILLMLPAAFEPGTVEELKPILKSGWLGIHTTLAVLGDAAFAFAFIVSIMYLLQERQLKSKHLGAIFHRLPSLEVMDIIGYKAISFGWPLFTLGMVTGSL